MALIRYTSYVEIGGPEEAEAVLSEIGNALCGAPHDIGDPGHECGREFAVLAGAVDDDGIDWKKEIGQSFAALLPKGAPSTPSLQLVQDEE